MMQRVLVLAGLLLAAPCGAVNLGTIGHGIACNDGATGTGYIMYTEENIYSRFPSPAPHSGASQHLICVRHDGSNWEYDNNAVYTPFSARPSDRLLAELDNTADTMRMLQDDCGVIHGMHSGYTNGDLTGHPNTWGVPQHRIGEWTIRGTYFDLCVCDPVVVGGSAVAGQALTGNENAMVGPSGLSLVNLQRLSWHRAGTSAHFPSLAVVVGTTITLTCCSGPCEFWISVYHCPPCSTLLNGGLPGILLGLGWDGGPCAPGFLEYSETYPMTTFHKHFGANAGDSFDTTARTSHIVIYQRDDDGYGYQQWCPPRYGPWRYVDGCTKCLHCEDVVHQENINVCALPNADRANNDVVVGFDLQVGDVLSVSVDVEDTWSAGGGRRTSNADGLSNSNPWCVANSGVCSDFGILSGLAPYGTLVARIGGGPLFAVGTSYNHAVSAAGRVGFAYFDTGFTDNSGCVAVAVQVRRACVSGGGGAR